MLKKIYKRLAAISCRIISRHSHFDIEVKNIDKTLDYILEHKSSVIRFGDGEFNLIRGKDIPFQNYEPELALKLKNILLSGSHDSLLICLPDVFTRMSQYTKSAQNFWEEHAFVQNRKLFKEIERKNIWYGSAFISRPYMDLKDKSNSVRYFRKLKSIWNKKDILIVEGKYTRSGEGNDLFENANSIKRIICPANNSYYKINEIEMAIRKNCSNRLVLLMLGPTAKIIVDDLNNIPNQLIDIGHIDSEYEWFQMKATHKVKIPHKHTAEFNFDDNQIDILHDNKLKKEICMEIE